MKFAPAWKIPRVKSNINVFIQYFIQLLLYQRSNNYIKNEAECFIRSSKTMKALGHRASVFIVSRCFEPLMKHLASFFTTSQMKDLNREHWKELTNHFLHENTKSQYCWVATVLSLYITDTSNVLIVKIKDLNVIVTMHIKIIVVPVCVWIIIVAH